MIIGTSHFLSFRSAVNYYHYGFTESEVKAKLDNKEISIGEPHLKGGEKCYLNKKENRYFIETKKD